MFDAVFWDFDGVLLNSNQIRDEGFAETLKNYPKKDVDSLLSFHRNNGGLSRYVKFRFFFEEIRGELISESEVQRWANRFSMIIKEKLISKELIITETIQLLESSARNTPMYIVSGSDEVELRYICQRLKLNRFFKGIYGSPTSKNELVGRILRKNMLNPKRTALVGDSINDYEAALINDVYFVPYNLQSRHEKYIDITKCIDFKDLRNELTDI